MNINLSEVIWLCSRIKKSYCATCYLIKLSFTKWQGKILSHYLMNHSILTIQNTCKLNIKKEEIFVKSNKTKRVAYFKKKQMKKLIK